MTEDQTLGNKSFTRMLLIHFNGQVDDLNMQLKSVIGEMKVFYHKKQNMLLPIRSGGNMTRNVLLYLEYNVNQMRCCFANHEWGLQGRE